MTIHEITTRSRSLNSFLHAGLGWAFAFSHRAKRTKLSTDYYRCILGLCYLQSKMRTVRMTHISVAHFLTVADVERSARCYEKVVGARILTMGDGNAPPYLQLANIWTILNVSWIGTCPITA